MSIAFASLLRHQDGWPHLLAAAYAAAGYAGGMAMLTLAPWWANALGVVLLGHAMVIAAYMVHECAHNTVFKSPAHNARLGKALNWLTGGCYGTYDDLRHKHMRHHVDRADVVSFDYREFLKRRPFMLRLVQALEWLYVPATEIVMHASVVVRPFVYPSLRRYRKRVFAVLAVRASLFAALAWVAPKAVLLYALSYVLFLTVMRFMDMHQHTFEVSVALGEGDAPRKRFDRQYEYRNTFSNPISMSHPWLNLLTLNFGYHNAHHDKPTEPWYRLAALHRNSYRQEEPQVLAFRNLVKSYHRHRVARVLNTDVGDIDIGQGQDRGVDFIGVYGVSFLTAL